MTLEDLRTDLRALLDDALPDLAGEREPLQAERIACLVALPAIEVEGAHAVIVEELEARGGPEAADLLAVMADLHPDPLATAAAAAAQRLGGGRAPAVLELGRVLRLEGEDASLLAAEVRGGGAAFALTVASDAAGLSGGLGQPATPEEVAEALDEVQDAETLHPSVAAAALRSLLQRAAEEGVAADEGLTLDGQLVVRAFGLEPADWPDLPLLVAPEFEPEPEPVRSVPPRPPADAARKKAKRRSQKASRKRNR